MKRTPPIFVMLVAFLSAASTWFYMNHILRPAQIEYAQAHDQPRGNLSDLYPRWLGARELLLHGRNPYSEEITLEIQKGYYGRVLDPSRPGDPKDRQGFAYPVYVVFLLAPAIRLPFDVVQSGFRWLLVGLTGVSVLWWLRVVQWKVSGWSKMVCVVLALGSIAVAQGIKLQQLSLLVAGLLAACGASLVSGYFFCAGALLAVATIKPQLTWPLVAWLLVWAASERRSRWRFALGFGIVMLLLLGGAEVLLPGWWRMFLDGLGKYHQYTQNESVLQWMFGIVLGRIFSVAAVLACGFCLWPLRREAASSERFGESIGLVLALTGLIVPMYAPYNQVLLLPAILVLVRRKVFEAPATHAAAYPHVIAAILLVWPWIATLGLSAATYWLSSAIREKVWPLPFYSTFAIPMFVFGLALLDTWTNPRHVLRPSESAE